MLATAKRSAFEPVVGLVLGFAFCLSATAGCAKGVAAGGEGGHAAGAGGGPGTGSGGNASGGAGTGGGAAGGGTGGSGMGGAVVTGAGGQIAGGGTGGETSAPDGGGADHVCQMAEYTFEPKVPTVYLMVDRSSSMFACVGETNNQAPPCATPANSYWDRLHQSIVQVVQQLDAQVRFGFATFSGTSGGTCPDVRKVSPALNNGDAIVTLYNSLPFRTATDKWETPMRRTLEMLGAELMSITAPGDKYILLVTDGEPDYCGDGNLLCPPDSVAAELQTLKAAGITTIVFGLQSKVGDISPAVLQAFANAGAGEPTVAPLRSGADINSIFDQCFPGGDSSTAGWRADFLAKYPECATNSNACRGRTIGTYAATAGPTKPYTPDPSNQAALVQQLSQVLSNVKSCLFDLGDINGISIRVDLTQLADARVLIQGKTVARDDSNGWRMNTTTQLELVGSACTTWKTPGNDNIDFQFPCTAIIFE